MRRLRFLWLWCRFLFVGFFKSGTSRLWTKNGLRCRSPYFFVECPKCSTLGWMQAEWIPHLGWGFPFLAAWRLCNNVHFEMMTDVPPLNKHGVWVMKGKRSGGALRVFASNDGRKYGDEAEYGPQTERVRDF